LPGRRGGHCDVFVAQDFGSAELVKTHCLHR
jgi:hypothetical protein